jgi:hypothetical protein
VAIVAEYWANFGSERDEFLDWMFSEKIDGVFFISGDWHVGSLSRIDYSLEGYNMFSKLSGCVDRIPEKFLKHLEGTDGLYEIRIKAGSNIYRVFCCFDAGRIVILFNGFVYMVFPSR